LTETLEEQFKQFFSIKNSSVIYNPSPKSKIITKIFKDENLNILYVGNINERKGIYNLISAFAEISINNKIRLKILGNGEVFKAKELAKKLKVEHLIEFIGWVDGKEKENHYLGAQIFCLPSYTEGLPMSILEAASYGLSIISSNVGGITDIFKNKENALIINPQSIEELKSALELLIKDSSLRGRLSESAKKLSITKLNIDNIAKQVDNLYNKLIN